MDILLSAGSQLGDNLMSMDRIGRPLISAAIGSQVTPLVLQAMTGDPASALAIQNAVPLLNRVIGTSLEPMYYGAFFGFVGAYVTDYLQSMVIGPGRTGRLTHFPSLVLHAASGAAVFSYFPSILESGGFKSIQQAPDSEVAGGLRIAGTITELLSQLMYEAVFTQGNASLEVGGGF